MKTKPKRLVGKIVILMLVLDLALGTLFYFQMHDYEDGIIDVYATQQDSYVQLVLDQINLKDNREDEEIIKEILSTLDASTNKYWTFTKAQSMLFVKDVLETNKYKGITAESYFDASNSRKFFDSLVLNRVKHADVTINGKKYVASGVVYEYNNSEYKLCLLTNKSILLENNKFLGSKVLMCTVIAIVLIAMFIATTVSARKIQAAYEKNNQHKRNVEELQKSVAELNEALREKRSRDTKQRLWSEDLISDFISRCKERNVVPVTFSYIKCADENAKGEFLGGANITLDEAVVRFAVGENDLFLLGTKIRKGDMESSLKPIMTEGCKCVETIEINLPENLDKALIFNAFKECEAWQN